MNIETILNEVKEYAHECVWKNNFECINASDAMIEAYLRPLMNDKEFEIFLRYRELMLRVFKETVKEELNWLNI